MFERMLDQSAVPTMDDMAAHCGVCDALFRSFNAYLTDELHTVAEIRFPYGKSYGWGVKHSVKGKYACDVFPEAGAFNLMVRLSAAQCERAYLGASDELRYQLDHKYPCGDGGWLHDRITNESQLAEAERLMEIKITTK